MYFIIGDKTYNAMQNKDDWVFYKKHSSKAWCIIFNTHILKWFMDNHEPKLLQSSNFILKY